MYRWLLLERLVSSNKTSCRASFSSKIKNVSKRKSKREFAKAVVTQIQNRAIMVPSQGEMKSQLQAPSHDQVSSQVQDSQANSCVASQGQVLTQAQLASQNNVSSQATASQGQAQSQAQLTSQHNASSQDSVATQAQSVSSQPIAPTPSQRSVPSSQGAVQSQKRKRDDIIADMPCLAAIIEADQQATSSGDSQDVQQKTNE